MTIDLATALSGLPSDVIAGQAVYSPWTLRIYDQFVLGFSSRFLWRCPAGEVRGLYDRHVTSNHLDVGVGTGYFLDRCWFPVERPRIVLMDLNLSCLEAAAKRIARYQPQTLQRNILEPIAFDGEPFDSIGLNFVLHCLPGTMIEKARVFDHLQRLLKPGGVLFGSMLLGEGVRTSALARRLMAVYNRKGIFSNTTDSLIALEAALQERFDEVNIRTVGCAALFWARERP